MDKEEILFLLSKLEEQSQEEFNIALEKIIELNRIEFD